MTLNLLQLHLMLKEYPQFCEPLWKDTVACLIYLSKKLFYTMEADGVWRKADSFKQFFFKTSVGSIDGLAGSDYDLSSKEKTTNVAEIL